MIVATPPVSCSSRGSAIAAAEAREAAGVTAPGVQPPRVVHRGGHLAAAADEPHGAACQAAARRARLRAHRKGAISQHPCLAAPPEERHPCAAAAAGAGAGAGAGAAASEVAIAATVAEAGHDGSCMLPPRHHRYQLSSATASPAASSPVNSRPSSATASSVSFTALTAQRCQQPRQQLHDGVLATAVLAVLALVRVHVWDRCLAELPVRTRAPPNH